MIANSREESVDIQNFAKQALAKMKELEVERNKEMQTLRLDRNTVISATPERLKQIKSHYKIK